MAVITFYEIIDEDFTGIEIEVNGKTYSNYEADIDKVFSNQSYELDDLVAMQLVESFKATETNELGFSSIT